MRRRMSRPHSNILDVTVRTDTLHNKGYVWCQFLNKFVKVKRKPDTARSGFCRYNSQPLHISKILKGEYLR
jgi:hypothetical protein